MFKAYCPFSGLGMVIAQIVGERNGEVVKIVRDSKESGFGRFEITAKISHEPTERLVQKVVGEMIALTPEVKMMHSFPFTERIN